MLLKSLRNFLRLKRHYQSIAMQRSGVVLGKDSKWNGKRPEISNSGTITIGREVQLHGVPNPVRLMTTQEGAIEIGDRSFVNTGVTIYSNSRVSIGARALIGDYCVINDTSFHAVHHDQTPISKPITIGKNVWLGINVIVLPGVTIGDHAVIAAGSVVFDDVPPAEVWRGNPAQFVKKVRAVEGFERV
jgi:acetyltransferase-like isoleucine patch superfamily enzyme